MLTMLTNNLINLLLISNFYQSFLSKLIKSGNSDNYARYYQISGIFVQEFIILGQIFINDLQVFFKTCILARFQLPSTIFHDFITSQNTLGPPNKSDNSKKRQSKEGYNQGSHLLNGNT